MNMLRTMLAPISFIGTILLLQGPPTHSQRTSDCLWNLEAQTAPAECTKYAEDCPGCCLHYHQTMNWSRCTKDGDQRKVGVTKKYFQAVISECDRPTWACTAGQPGSCEHFRNDCETEECD